MKKYLTLSLLLLMFSCRKELKETDSKSSSNSGKDAISFEQAVNMVRASSSSLQPSLQSLQTTSTNIALTGQGYCVQNTNTTTSGIVFSTNGKAYHSGNSISLDTKNVGADVQGAGIAVNFPFKHGKNYTITITLSNYAEEVDNEVASKKRRPSLQAQLTNNVLASINNCSVVTPPIILGGSDPVQTVPPQTDSEEFEGKRTITFTPSQCYNFLRLSGIPNMTGKSKGWVLISALSITQIDGIEILGPNTLTNNEQGTFSVGYNGFPIGSAFTWKVEGGLQIVGASTGTSAVIKAINFSGGRIIIDYNGCQMIAYKVLPSLAANYTSLSGLGQVNSDITDPVRFSIVLSGPLAGKTITNTQWTVPEDWDIWYSNNEYIELMPQSGALGGFLEVNFKVDGAPVFLSKFIKVFPVH
ncbi:hypothetical protein [Pedobacter sp. B4-66]|uniref:hypothetical protein n=1 Tax=Pedobacter sp. B4-66 TaxID=2817280 RepID=UPI001BD9A697|nr:hypothetical protein [Pedobacter sp. B4-66]